MFWLDIYDPQGERAHLTFGNPYTYTLEVYIEGPVAGSWLIRVIPIDVEGSAFRMRAKLEARPVTGTEVRSLVPNLQVVPPFDFVFAGCQASEIAVYAPARCLRFSTCPPTPATPVGRQSRSEKP